MLPDLLRKVQHRLPGSKEANKATSRLDRPLFTTCADTLFIRNVQGLHSSLRCNAGVTLSDRCGGRPPLVNFFYSRTSVTRHWKVKLLFVARTFFLPQCNVMSVRLYAVGITKSYEAFCRWICCYLGGYLLCRRVQPYEAEITNHQTT